MRRYFLIFILLMVTIIRPVWCNHVIAEATLHITLYVPPKPIKEEIYRLALLGRVWDVAVFPPM